MKVNIKQAAEIMGMKYHAFYKRCMRPGGPKVGGMGTNKTEIDIEELKAWAATNGFIVNFANPAKNQAPAVGNDSPDDPPTAGGAITG